MVDLDKVRSFPRFALFAMLIAVLGLVLFFIRMIGYEGGQLPDLTTSASRGAFLQELQFIFALLFIPGFFALLIFGYPVWRMTVSALARRGIGPWFSIAGGALGLAIVAILPFVLLFAVAGASGDIAKSGLLLVFVSGTVFSASSLIGHFLYRGRAD
ncbi:MAG: hypothetical protein AAFP98_06275 [Pseudomonadota bacterium]